MIKTIRKRLLSKSIFIALLLVSTLVWNKDVISQTIDTMYITPATPTDFDSVFVHIEGERYNPVKLTATTVQIFDNDVNIIFHYNFCGGWTMTLPIHDSVNIGCLLPNTYTIKCIMLFDTVLHNPNCQPFNSLFLADSSFIQVTVTFIENYENYFEVIIYPNPASDVLYIQTQFPEEPSRLTITDITGRTVYQSTFTSRICVSHLPKGMYVLTVHTNDGQFVRKCIVL